MTVTDRLRTKARERRFYKGMGLTCRQEANHLMTLCYDEENANGILSSDVSVIWHVEGLPEFPEGL